MRLLGVTMAYNEADCIQRAVRGLLRCSDLVLVFDHGSTDATRDLVRSIRGPVELISVDRDEYPMAVKGRRTAAFFRFIAARILDARADFDWVTWIAADEILRQPDGSLATEAAICEAAKHVDVIRPLLRDFWMTAFDTGSNGDYVKRIRWYRPNPAGHCPRSWRLALTPRHIHRGLHIRDPRLPGTKSNEQAWPAGTRVSNNEWLLDHYCYRSRAQAARKLGGDRPWKAAHYDNFRRNPHAIVKKDPTGEGLKREKRVLEAP